MDTGQSCAGCQTVQELQKTIDDFLRGKVRTWEELLIERLDLAEETGSCATQKHLVSAFARKVSLDGSEALQLRFSEFKVRVQSNLAYEEKHGRQSLLKKDHPFNVRLLEMGLGNAR